MDDTRKLQSAGGWFLSSHAPWLTGLLRNLVLGIIAAAIVILGDTAVSLPDGSPVWAAGVLAIVIAFLRAIEGWYDQRHAQG